jgi:hypothetical protein
MTIRTYASHGGSPMARYGLQYERTQGHQPKMKFYLAFYLFMGLSLAAGLIGTANTQAIETCQERGGSVDECHLIVLGR